MPFFKRAAFTLPLAAYSLPGDHLNLRQATLVIPILRLSQGHEASSFVLVKLFAVCIYQIYFLSIRSNT